MSQEPHTELLPQGTVLLVEGQEVTHIISLFAGQVELTRKLKDGMAFSVLVFDGNGLLALPEAMLHKPAWCTCTALTSVRIRRYSLKKFEEWRSDDNHPERWDMPMRVIARLCGSLVDRNAELALAAGGVPKRMRIGDTGAIEDELSLAFGSLPNRVMSGHTPVEGMPIVEFTPRPEPNGTPREHVVEFSTADNAVPIQTDDTVSKVVFDEHHVGNDQRSLAPVPVAVDITQAYSSGKTRT
jgi:CRP-like cAMP-binding protein